MIKLPTLVAWIALATTTHINAQNTPITKPGGVIITISNTQDSIQENLKETDSVGSQMDQNVSWDDSIRALEETLKRDESVLDEDTESFAPVDSIVESIRAQEKEIETLIITKHISDTVLNDDIYNRICQDYPTYENYSAIIQNQILLNYLKDFPEIPPRAYFYQPIETPNKNKAKKHRK